MPDKYSSFAALEKNEVGSFNIVVEPHDAHVAVVAPHAGGIEPGTSEVGRLIAQGAFPLYLFEGTKKAHNADLHITSARFDEPQCLALLKSVDAVVTIHGEGSKGKEAVFLGGLHEPLKRAIRKSLEADGFLVMHHSTLRGSEPANICNRGRSGHGVQLELSAGLRSTFFESLTPAGRRKGTERLALFCKCVRTALIDWQRTGTIAT